MIPVRNIYYMLSYAFQVLQEKQYKNLDGEEFEDAEDMLAAVLCRGIAVLVRRGLGRQYIVQEEATSTPQGKILLSESIRFQASRKLQLACSYDEFSIDSCFNRIIKTTMQELLRTDKLKKERKKELCGLLPYFDGVSVLDKRYIQWDHRYDRNNQIYRMLVSVCHLIMDRLIPNPANDGTNRIRELDDRKIEKLYEKFILEYYKKEHKELHSSAPQIEWKTDDDNRYMLPRMQTDVVLRNERTNKTLIIDAKYYTKNTQSRVEESHTIHSGNLYQIYSYVRNWHANNPEETVSGLLLYAKTDFRVQPDDIRYRMEGNEISIRTLDLNCTFDKIKAQLDNIAATLSS